MARHTGDEAVEAPRRWFVPAVVAGLIVVLLVVIVLVDVARPGTIPGLERFRPAFAAAPGTACPPTTVEVVVTSEAAAAVTQILAPLRGRRLSDGHCLVPTVRGQDSAETLASSRVVAAGQAPGVWIPQSSIWSIQLEYLLHTWPIANVGSFASSPVLLAGGVKAVAARGWDVKTPTWAEALTSQKAPSVLSLPASTAGLVTLAGEWNALGRGSPAAQTIAAAVLAMSRAGSAGLDLARDAAKRQDPAGPVALTTEAEVASARRIAPDVTLTTVYPQGGTVPVLDYPILRIGGPTVASPRRIAVDAVVSALLDDETAPVLSRNGLREPAARIGGSPASAPASTAVSPVVATPVSPVVATPVSPTSSAASSAAGPVASAGAEQHVTPLPLPAPPAVAAFLEFLQALAKPSRILSVVDVSLSMKTLVPGTPLTRIDLAGKAAAAAGNLLTDASSAGLWIFAHRFPDGKPYQQLAGIDRLGAADNGKSHREVVIGSLLALGDKLSGGGTSLYATALAAVRQLRTDYDARAVNTVVLFTDGFNEGDTVTLESTVKALQADLVTDPGKPVSLIAVGLGPTADVAALKALTDAAGAQSQTYRANTPEQLRTVLFDALSRRPATA